MLSILCMLYYMTIHVYNYKHGVRSLFFCIFVARISDPRVCHGVVTGSKLFYKFSVVLYKDPHPTCMFCHSKTRVVPCIICATWDGVHWVWYEKVKCAVSRKKAHKSPSSSVLVFQKQKWELSVLRKSHYHFLALHKVLS